MTGRDAAHRVGLLVSLVAVGCGGLARAAPGGSGADQAPEIHAGVVGAVAARTQATRLVVGAETWEPGEGPLGIMARRFAELPQVDESATVDFLASNRTAGMVAMPAGLRAVVTLVSPAELEPGPGEDPAAFWSAFFDAHPDAPGWVRLTRPGLGADGTTAIVAAELRCGPRCGHGMGYVLRRAEGEWRVEVDVVLWIH